MKDDPRDRGNEEDPGDVPPEDPSEGAGDVAPEEGSTDAGGIAPEEPPRDTGDAAAERPAAWLCDLCGGPMLERHCRLICVQCGYQRDCTDP